MQWIPHQSSSGTLSPLQGPKPLLQNGLLTPELGTKLRPPIALHTPPFFFILFVCFVLGIGYHTHRKLARWVLCAELYSQPFYFILKQGLLISLHDPVSVSRATGF